MALEKVTRAQECPVVQLESKTKINGSDVDKVACACNPSQESKANDGKAQFAHGQAEIENRNSEAARFQAYENECGSNGVDKKSSGGDDDGYNVDPSLSHCYEKLRAQIVEVAERMEKLILTLKADVQRITTDMQVKLCSLERRAQHLEETIPLKQLMGRKMLASDINLLHSYDVNSNATDISQNQTMSQQEQLSTKELIASVKARCNKTKELLMGKGWAVGQLDA